MMDTTYRDFIISFDPPPFGSGWANWADWRATHKDYDGTEDGNDHRYFHGPSEADCKAQVDEWYDENTASPASQAGACPSPPVQP